MSTSQGKTMTVAIPLALFKQIEARISGSGFPSVESYITHVLQDVLAKDEAPDTIGPEEEARVRERLRALGYLD